MYSIWKKCIILIAFGIIITGIVSLKFPLSSQPNLGDWKIEAVCKVYTYFFFSFSNYYFRCCCYCCYYYHCHYYCYYQILSSSQFLLVILYHILAPSCSPQMQTDKPDKNMCCSQYKANIWAHCYYYYYYCYYYYYYFYYYDRCK